MTIENGYASVAEFAEHLASDRIAEDDPQVERAIEAASRVIDGATHRRFYADENPSARLFRATPGLALYIDDYVELVSVTPETTFGVLGTAYATTDYRAGPYNAAIDGRPYTYIEGLTSWGTQVSVVARWGWPSVPKPITLACLLLSARYYKRRETVTATLGFDDFAVRLSTTDPDVAAMIAPYRFTAALVG